jgi:hypothetical protein
MSRTTIHLKPSKLKQRFQVINDAFPGVILLFSGLEVLFDHGFIPSIIPYISVVVGIVVIRSAIEELRHRNIHRKLNWFDISGGCVILIEAASRYKSYKGFQPAHLYFLAGLVTILRGIFSEKFPKMRRVVLSDDGIFARTALLRWVSCSWADLLRIDRSTNAIVFVRNNHNTTLNLRRVENRAEVIERIVEAAKEHGILIEGVV